MKRDWNEILKYWGSIVCVLIWVFGFVACSDDSVSPKTGNLNLVAQVNQQPISRERLARELVVNKRKFRINQNEKISLEKLIWLRNNTLNEIIKEIVLLEEVKKFQISLDQDEFNILLSSLQQGYEKDLFQKELESQEVTKEEWEEKLRRRLLIQKLINERVNSKVSIDEEVLRSYFEAHQDEFQKGQQVRALQIMLETEDEARRILKLIRKGKSFSDLARDHSKGLESSQGGDMGFFEAGQLPEQFDELFRLEVNKVSDIIRTPYGHHIFKVVEKLPARKMKFEESKPEIYKKLLLEAQEKAFQSWLDNLKSKSNIVINYEILETVS